MKSTPDFAAMKKEDRIAKWTRDSPREAERIVIFRIFCPAKLKGIFRNHIEDMKSR